jgi:hypothetical protein
MVASGLSPATVRKAVFALRQCLAGATGCNVREVSESAGHNSVAFTLTHYGGLSSRTDRTRPSTGWTP